MVEELPFVFLVQHTLISYLVCSRMESPVKDLTFTLQQNGIPSERSHIHFAAEWNPQ